MNHYAKVCRREKKINSAAASIDDDTNGMLTVTENTDLYPQGACSASMYP